MRYVVDTNVFNWIADGRLSQVTFPSDAELLATPVQIDEINSTRNAERRAHLVRVFEKVSPQIVPTESGIYGASRLGEFKWSNGSRLQSLKSALNDQLKKQNNIKDAQILEVAVANNYGLITADQALSEVAKAHNVPVYFVA